MSPLSAPPASRACPDVSHMTAKSRHTQLWNQIIITGFREEDFLIHPRGIDLVKWRELREEKGEAANLENFVKHAHVETCLPEVLAESLLKLKEEGTGHSKSIRWEFGACWVQHLQNKLQGKLNQKNAEEAKL